MFSIFAQPATSVSETQTSPINEGARKGVSGSPPWGYSTCVVA
nr:mating factor a1.2 [Ustilago filiformis]